MMLFRSNTQNIRLSSHFGKVSTNQKRPDPLGVVASEPAAVCVSSTNVERSFPDIQSPRIFASVLAIVCQFHMICSFNSSSQATQSMLHISIHENFAKGHINCNDCAPQRFGNIYYNLQSSILIFYNSI